MPPELDQEKKEKWTSVYGSLSVVDPAPDFSPFTVCPLSELLAVVLMVVVEEEEGREGEERRGETQRKLAMDKDRGRSVFLQNCSYLFCDE